MSRVDLNMPVVEVGDQPPLFREEACECGELPMLINGIYVCTNPGCPCYGEEAWEPPIV